MEKLSLSEVKSFYPQEKLDKDLDQLWILALLYANKECNIPIIIDKNNQLVDGYHRYEAKKRLNEEYINVIKLDVDFTETNILRDFQKHLKNMTPKDWTLWKTKVEFDELIPWLQQHIIKN